MFNCIWLYVGLVHSVVSKSLFIELDTPNNDELLFMKKYGYLPEETDEFDFAYTPKSISEAVKKVQAFAGLPQTGIMDVDTKKLFKKRRCGMKDLVTSHRQKRYIVQQGWNKKVITYRVINGARTLAKSRIEKLMAAGLGVWAPHGRLHFSQVDSGRADIKISFARLEHGDGFPFDGQGHVVAHAFPPPHGAMHFDDDELWGENSLEDDEDTTDFFAVAVHEIGHALGLSHSNVKASVMYPYYQVPVEKLHIDDILGIQELYIKDQQQSPSKSTESPVLSHSSFIPRFSKADSEEDDVVPDLCYTNYDTIQVIQGKIFVFEEEWMWVLHDRKEIAEGYPKRFHNVFIALPKHVNLIKTIYERRDGDIVIFSGKKYWKFDPNFRFIKAGHISDYLLPRYVKELSTVFVSNYNNKTYLIDYERFWRYDEETQSMDKGYPKEMSAWRRVPYPVDAALIWKGDTFFFRGPRFWRFDNAIVQAHEYYPLPTAQIWFPCEASPDMNRYVTNDDT